MPEAVSTHIPEAVTQRFRSLLSLPPEKLRKFNQWLREHANVLTSGSADHSELSAAGHEIGISAADVAAGLAFVGTMLFAGAVPGKADIRELEQLGLRDVADGATVVLDGLSIPGAQAEYARQKGLALNSALPTLESVDAVCDLRAVFGRRSASVPSESAGATQKLLGFEPVVLLGLELNDSVGNDSTAVFQLSETTLTRLIKTLQDTAGQLEIIKSHRK